MSSYKQVKQQIAVLEKKAVELRRIEAAKVIADIKRKIAQFDLQAEDLFGSFVATESAERPASKVKRLTPKVVSAPKYMDPDSGKTWTGHGKSPNWIKGATNREDFLIATVKAKSAPAAKSVAAPKSTAKPVSKGAGKTAAQKVAPKKSAISQKSVTAPKTTRSPVTTEPVIKSSLSQPDTAGVAFSAS